MNITAIKEMIARIKQDTGVQIIKGNTTAPRPSLPFGMYNITSPYIKGRGRGANTFYSDDTNLYEKREEEYRFTLSFSIYAQDTETTISLAHKVRQWFLFLGREFIQDKKLVVANVGNIENRTTFLVDSYEYKFGFDVQFRDVDEQIKVIEAIEEANPQQI